MWMGQDGEGFRVLDVIADGPASRAGLAAGDVVTSVDGVRVDRLLLPDVRMRFRTDPAGTRVRLGLRSGERAREVTLVLRDLV
jgi:C-terminal processing protease CtpA/Prc